MLLFGLHCHQPVDNFGWVVDRAIKDCYKPLITTFDKYPNFKFSIHFSGWLLEYIRKHSPDVFSLMQAMSEKKQVEFFSGGFYEPILESIPAEDRVKQIGKMNNYIKRYFGQTPKGLWLTERVYSDSIVEDVAKSGIEYMVIDDIFTDRFSYTQANNHVLKLLPINKMLRYSIPFKEVDSVEILLKSRDINIIFDDCEKFGVWPGTYEWVYKKRWLEKFLSKNFETILPREFVKQHKPVCVTLPSHSYREMELWSLDSDEYFEYKKLEGKLVGEDERLIERFTRGSVWKNFLNKYFEANWIQKRVWQLSENKINSRKYLDSLFKAQCNDVLWHGVFGGLYLPNLRDNAYRYIIECENMLKTEAMEKKDIDLDLNNEFKYKTENYIAIFNSFGELIEFDDRKNLFNFQNTLKRYKERYHLKKGEKKEFDTIHNLSFDFSKYPVKFDDYFKFSFITGSDTFKISHLKNRLNFYGNRTRKSYKFFSDRIEFFIEGSKTLEMNFHFAGSYETSTEDKKFLIQDEYTKRTIALEFDVPYRLKSEDIVTYSLREDGADEIIQGVSFKFEFDYEKVKGNLCLG